MLNIDKYIPKEYLALKINYRRRQLVSLPEVKITEHKVTGVPTAKICVRNHTYRPNTPAGKKCIDLMKLRTRYEHELNIYEAVWKAHFVDEPAKEMRPFKIRKELQVAYNAKVVMDKAFFDSLKNDANTRHTKPGNCYFNGIYYRSAAEREIALTLTDMGIPFKYEPELSLVGINHTINPDFVIYIEEIDTCFIIEHLGIKNSSDYLRDNKIKHNNYSNAGLVSGEDVIFTNDTDGRPFDVRSLASAINHAIFVSVISSVRDSDAA